MRLLFLQEADWLNRNPAQQHHLAEMLSLRGYEVRAIDYELLWSEGKRRFHSGRQIFSNVSKIHDKAKVTVIRPGIVRLPLLSYVSLLGSHSKEIHRQIAEFKPDAVVGWGILNSYLAAKAVRKTAIPFLYYWIDVLDRLIPEKFFRFLGRLIESRTLKQSDRVLTINEKLCDYVVSLGAPRERSQVLRAGISIEKSDPALSGDKVRQQYGLDNDDIVLFFMGWLYRFSGLKEVALELARNPDPKLKFLILGEGDAYEELQKIRESHHLRDRVILTGKKPYQEIPGFIAAADVCLLPAYTWEPIMRDIVPIKTYEYMAMQKPVISTRLPGVMKEFGEGNGVVYVDKPEEVVAKALELIRTGQARELGLKARKFVERNSWDRITDEFERILNEVIAEKKSPASLKFASLVPKG